MLFTEFVTNKQKPVTIIAGLPRSGKTALMTSIASTMMFGAGANLLIERSRRLVEKINNKGGYIFTPPSRPPVFSDYKIKVHTDYEIYTQSFFLSGWRFAYPNRKFKVINVVPGAAIFLPEAQIYYDSHDFQSFPDPAARKFETAGHASYQIFLDTQNPALINKSIRKLCGQYCWIVALYHEYDDVGNIIKSHWDLIVYPTYEDFDAKTNGVSTTYTHEGNVFELYESESYLMAHSPASAKKIRRDADQIPDNDFNYLEHPSDDDEYISEIYSKSAPKGWRDYGSKK